MINHRPSILHLKGRGTSQVSEETSEAQFQREQAYWAGKAERQAQTHDRIIRSIYPMPEDKRSMQYEYQQHMEQHSRAKQAEEQAAQQQELAWLNRGYGDGAAVVKIEPHDKPWLGSSMSYVDERQEKAFRRKHEEAAAEENRRLVAERAALRQREEELQAQRARSSIMAEEGFFNLGAVNDRWVPPDRRRFSPREGELSAAGTPSAYAAGAAAPPPWAGAGSPYQPAAEPVASRPSTASRPGTASRPSTASRPPWATMDDLPGGSGAARAPLQPAVPASSRPWATQADAQQPLPGYGRQAQQQQDRLYPWSWGQK